MKISKCFPILPFFLFVGGGCSSPAPVGFVMPTKQNTGQMSLQKAELEKAERLLAEEKWKEAEDAFASFNRQYPVSTFSARAYFGWARSLEAQKRFEEAITLYRRVGEQARTVAPETAALSYLRLSFCYEAQGDENRLMAALADAESLGSALPEEIRQIQLPARKAASLLRRGQNAEARQILKSIEKSLPDVSAESPAPQRAHQAELLLAMGGQRFEGVNAENFLSTLETFEALQTYLWKAIVLQSSPFSEQAAAQLTSGYSTLSMVAFDPPALTSGQNEETSRHWRSDLQKKWVGRLLESIQALKILAEGKISKGGSEFATLIGQIDDRGNQILWGRASLTPLTRESAPARSKRPVSVKKSEPLPEPEHPLDSEDPNLKNGGNP